MDGVKWSFLVMKNVSSANKSGVLRRFVDRNHDNIPIETDNGQDVADNIWSQEIWQATTERIWLKAKIKYHEVSEDRCAENTT